MCYTMVLYIESTIDQYGPSKKGPLLCRGTELHITKESITQTYSSGKIDIKSQSYCRPYNRTECLMVTSLVIYRGQDKSIENNGVSRYYTSKA